MLKLTEHLSNHILSIRRDIDFVSIYQILSHSVLGVVCYNFFLNGKPLSAHFLFSHNHQDN